MDLAAVDEWWTTWLGTTPDQLRTGGVAVADHVDHVGVVEVAHGQAPLVYGPSRWVNPLRDAALPATTLDEGLDLVRRTFGRRVTQVLGPAWYGYADRTCVSDDECDAVRSLGPADAGLVEALRTQVRAAEWGEAGMSTGADFGIVVDGVLRAAANVGQWRSMPSLGVLTHPAYRRRGLGREVARAAARCALIDAPRVQYRAWSTNAASIAVAERVGFVFYARGGGRHRRLRRRLVPHRENAARRGPFWHQSMGMGPVLAPVDVGVGPVLAPVGAARAAACLLGCGS